MIWMGGWLKKNPFFLGPMHRPLKQFLPVSKFFLVTSLVPAGDFSVSDAAPGLTTLTTLLCNL